MASNFILLSSLSKGSLNIKNNEDIRASSAHMLIDALNVLSMHAKIDFITEAFMPGDCSGHTSKETSGKKLLESMKAITHEEY
ncbi:MAG: hypothetical protein FP816_01720 [Desulfobacteraceae bacterium]|nr:hypothetical protein [Desulfobacteraceae bacterium]MBU4055000.1 hypothetical protein [Pseudomonadota bacterium]